MRHLSILALCTTLTACGGSPAVNNPDYFNFSFKDGQVNGEYNPAGWSTEEVQRNAARSACRGQMQNYAESKQSSGLIGFTASCVNPKPTGLVSVEVEKT